MRACQQITWQDKRAAAYADQLTKKFLFKFLRGFGKAARISGSAKMMLISMLQFPTDYASVRTGFFLENNPKIKEMVEDPNTNIIWGQIDSWILWNLTKGKI